jgi:hypothetical protein
MILEGEARSSVSYRIREPDFFVHYACADRTTFVLCAHEGKG